ncbi:MAG: response regulator [Halanaeroarchaeum sp.]
MTVDVDDEEPPVVLVVDDEPDLADLYVAWLEDEYRVRVAYDGASALEQLDESVDVVLLDRRMPTLSGDDVLTRIRDEPLDCRVAMVTAVEPDVDIVELGFDEYLQKPVGREELVDTVDRMQRRSDYDDSIQEFFAAVRKRTLLEERLSPAEREQSEAYQSLADEIEDLESNVDALTADFDEDDFALLFQQLDGGSD